MPGAILDVAATASDGVANALDTSDPDNTRSFDLGDTLSITLGASGYENLSVGAHDSGMVGLGLSSWGHDAPWLYPIGGAQNKGFVRFDWSAAFSAISGVTESSSILAAELSIDPRGERARRSRSAVVCSAGATRPPAATGTSIPSVRPPGGITHIPSPAGTRPGRRPRPRASRVTTRLTTTLPTTWPSRRMRVW